MFSDQKYYDTAEKAIQIAKIKIDNMIDGTNKDFVESPKCPYCGRKVNKAGCFYYSCINCGKIHKNYIK